jgi:hypothetical protein
VARYGLNIPYWDDWNLVPYAAGRQPITWQWLWALQEDHRIPLPKLIFVTLYRLGHGDVRVIMFANLAILCSIAWLGLTVARRRRGESQLSDALIPLLLVGIANYSNLVSANQIQYISSIGLFWLAVCVILWQPDWFRSKTVVGLGVCIVCLPLTGSTGVALVLPLLALLGVGALMHRHSQTADTRRACWVALGICGVAGATLVAYAQFGARPESPVLSAASNVGQFVTGTLQLAAVGFAGPVIAPPAGASPLELQFGARYFAADWVGRFWMVGSALVIAVAAGALAGMYWMVRQRREMTATVLGPLACLSSAGVLAIIIGFERGFALDQRYIILGATLIATTYLCLGVVRHAAATVAGWALLLLALWMFPWNAYNAFNFGEARHTFATDFARDVRAGVPVDLLGTRYFEDLWGDPSLAAGAITQMRDDQLGPFVDGSLRLNESQPVIRGEEAIPTTPVAVHNMSKVGEYWQGSGADSFLLFSVGLRQLAGVRLTYSLIDQSAAPAYFEVAWSNVPATDFSTRGNRYVVYGAPAMAQQQQIVAWIGNTVGLLRVTPDVKPTSFKLDEIVLLLAS